ncbi:MAG: hypothetical protein PHS92_03265 [Candidatus Gracilibacteria bacterium]|nr:hypothetical protein [Candidatus Gracilibacteria bacterium]
MDDKPRGVTLGGENNKKALRYIELERSIAANSDNIHDIISVSQEKYKNPQLYVADEEIPELNGIGISYLKLQSIRKRFKEVKDRRLKMLELILKYAQKDKKDNIRKREDFDIVLLPHEFMILSDMIIIDKNNNFIGMRNL